MWKAMSEYKEVPDEYPNEDVLLMVKVTEASEHQLVDAVPGTIYVTMGHWMPQIELSTGGDIPQGAIEPGHWEYVGWNWCQDQFVHVVGGTTEVVGWQPMPGPEEEEIIPRDNADTMEYKTHNEISGY